MNPMAHVVKPIVPESIASQAVASRVTLTTIPAFGANPLESASGNHPLEVAIDRIAAQLLANHEMVRRSLPDVAAEVLQLVQSTRSDATAIDKAISKDPFAAAQLVSMANSALFSPRQPILGVREAIVRLGLEQVRDVMMVIITQSKMFRIKGLEAQTAVLRMRSIGSGLAGRLIARLINAHQEYAFLVGLLHDVGHFLLLERCAEKGVVDAQLLSDPNLGPIARARFEMHHQFVGAIACQSWKLQSGVIDAAACHHSPRHDGKPHVAANIAALGDRMLDHLGMGCEPYPLDPSEPVCTDLGLRPEQVLGCLGELIQQLPAYTKVFSS